MLAFFVQVIPTGSFEAPRNLELGIMLKKISLQVEIFMFIELVSLNVFVDMSQAIHQEPKLVSQTS